MITTVLDVSYDRSLVVDYCIPFTREPYIFAIRPLLLRLETEIYKNYSSAHRVVTFTHLGPPSSSLCCGPAGWPCPQSSWSPPWLSPQWPGLARRTTGRSSLSRNASHSYWEHLEVWQSVGGASRPAISPAGRQGPAVLWPPLVAQDCLHLCSPVGFPGPLALEEPPHLQPLCLRPLPPLHHLAAAPRVVLPGGYKGHL